jgi:hypothetical protein
LRKGIYTVNYLSGKRKLLPHLAAWEATGWGIIIKQLNFIIRAVGRF